MSRYPSLDSRAVQLPVAVAVFGADHLVKLPNDARSYLAHSQMMHNPLLLPQTSPLTIIVAINIGVSIMVV